MPRYPTIEMARGIAALSVVLFHVATRLGQGTENGSVAAAALGTLSAGVPVFFAISGFVIGRPLVATMLNDEPWSGRRYARHRIIRIVPAYWLALTLLAIVPGLVGVFSGDWWMYYGFVQIYGPHAVDGLGPAWTLCVEMSFYLLLPILLLVVLRPVKSATILTGVILATALISATYASWRGQLPVSEFAQGWLYFTIVGTWCWFTPGLLLAVALARPDSHVARLGRRIDSSRWTPALAVGALIVGLAALAYGQRNSTQTLGYAFANTWIAAAGLTLAFSIRHRVQDRRVAPLIFLGAISYGVYLWHEPLIRVVREPLGLSTNEPLGVVAPVFVATTVLAIVCASASWRLVEKPLMQRAR